MSNITGARWLRHAYRSTETVYKTMNNDPPKNEFMVPITVPECIWSSGVILVVVNRTSMMQQSTNTVVTMQSKLETHLLKMYAV